MATVHSSRGKRPYARKKSQRLTQAANQPVAAKLPVSIGKLITDTVEAISLIECAQRSLSDQEVGAPEQIVLERARKALWRLHDDLDELPRAADDEEDDKEDES